MHVALARALDLSGCDCDSPLVSGLLCPLAERCTIEIVRPGTNVSPLLIRQWVPELNTGSCWEGGAGSGCSYSCVHRGLSEDVAYGSCAALHCTVGLWGIQ